MWIKCVSEDEATGMVAKIYKGTTRSWGGVGVIGFLASRRSYEYLA
jgi:hypothetical protein